MTPQNQKTIIYSLLALTGTAAVFYVSQHELKKSIKGDYSLGDKTKRFLTETKSGKIIFFCGTFYLILKTTNAIASEHARLNSTCATYGGLASFDRFLPNWDGPSFQKI